MPDRARLSALLAAAGGASSDFDLNPGLAPPAGQALRPAAVLVPVLARPDGLRLLLTTRASHLAHHPGQVSFPGGKIEASDPSPEAAALREAQEEIGLPATAVTLLGRLAPHVTVTGFQVTPVLGLIEAPFVPQPDPGEVAEVFDLPFSHVLSPARYSIEKRLWHGVWRQYYTVPWGPHYIWGATARILHGLALGARHVEMAQGALGPDGAGQGHRIQDQRA